MIAGAAEILLQAMLDKGIVVESVNLTPEAWVGVVGPLLPDNDRAIGFIDSGAWLQAGARRIQRTGEVIEHPKVQLMIRAENYPVGLDKGKDLELNFLDKIGAGLAQGILYTVVNGIQYTVTAVFPLSRLAYLGSDKDNRRCLFSINCQVEYHD